MVIDRIEGDFAVVENEGIMLDIPLSQLPCDVKEGDIITFSNGVYIVDNKSAQEQREEISARLENLFKRKQK
ncbi:MAG: DUF3006 domain-containing protein [Ruminococcus sp.]|nr:DUF3006 domain-containing protein [Ruminococcus sp.]